MSPNYFEHTSTYNHTIESVRVRELYHYNLKVNLLTEPIKGRLKVDMISESPHPDQCLEDEEDEENIFSRIYKL